MVWGGARQLDRNSGELQLKGIVLLLEAGEADDEVKKVNEIIDTNVPFYLRKRGRVQKRGRLCVSRQERSVVGVSSRAKQ